MVAVECPPAAGVECSGSGSRRGRRRGASEASGLPTEAAEWVLDRGACLAALLVGVLRCLGRLLLELRRLLGERCELLFDLLGLAGSAFSTASARGLVAALDVARRVEVEGEVAVGAAAGVVLGDDPLRLGRALRVLELDVGLGDERRGPGVGLLRLQREVLLPRVGEASKFARASSVTTGWPVSGSDSS